MNHCNQLIVLPVQDIAFLKGPNCFITILLSKWYFPKWSITERLYKQPKIFNLSCIYTLTIILNSKLERMFALNYRNGGEQACLKKMLKKHYTTGCEVSASLQPLKNMVSPALKTQLSSLQLTVKHVREKSLQILEYCPIKFTLTDLLHAV